MATIVNNPPATQDSSGASAGWAIAIILLVVLLIAYFGFAHWGGHTSTSNINVSLPSGGSGSGGSAGGSGATGP